MRSNRLPESETIHPSKVHQMALLTRGKETIRLIHMKIILAN